MSRSTLHHQADRVHQRLDGQPRRRPCGGQTRSSRRSAARATSPRSASTRASARPTSAQQGFEQELKKYPNVKYLGTQSCNDDQTKASQPDVCAPERRTPNLKGIFAMNVVSGNGVTAAVKAAGKSGKVKLVEFDAGPPRCRHSRPARSTRSSPSTRTGSASRPSSSLPVRHRGTRPGSRSTTAPARRHHAANVNSPGDQEVPLHPVARGAAERTGRRHAAARPWLLRAETLLT